MKIYLKFGIFLYLIFTFTSSYTQQSETFEEKVLLEFEKDSADIYDLLNAVNYNKDLYNRGKVQIYQHINTLKDKNLQQKPLKKQIQTIYKTTHSRFLKKYEAKSYFNDIFRSGNYNCVTATALYAIILDEFNIDYSIRETPTHVYLIADTLGLQSLIETTLPTNGVVLFNEKFKKDFVSYLNKNKIISDQEYQSSTTDELFREYYSKDKSINLTQLAALQYYNKGAFLMEEKKFLGAASSLNTAMAIYPSNSIKYNHFAALQNAIAENYNNKVYNGKLLGQVILSIKEDSTLAQLAKDYFDFVSVKLCVNEPDINKYNSFYSEITAISDSNDIPDYIQYRYHYYKSYNMGLNGNYTKALTEIKNAYDLNKDDLQVQELAYDLGIKHLFLESKYKRQIDSLEYYFEELPFLVENQMFQQQYVYYYMKVISDCFMYNEPVEGQQYYKRFLKNLDKYQIAFYSDEHISLGFSIMAFYYAGKNDFKKSLKIINNGLEIAPESLRLKQARVELEDALKSYQNYNHYQSQNSRNSDIIYYDPRQEEREALKANVEKHFPGNWKAIAIIIEDMEQKLNQNEVFELRADKNKNCTYTYNGKTEKGKWAYRPKSKCIYFVPNYDKDQYKVFKIKEISSGKIVLLPYKDQRNPSPYKYVLKPI